MKKAFLSVILLATVAMTLWIVAELAGVFPNLKREVSRTNMNAIILRDCYQSVGEKFKKSADQNNMLPVNIVDLYPAAMSDCLDQRGFTL